jgi:hypothetical protein
MQEDVLLKLWRAIADLSDNEEGKDSGGSEGGSTLASGWTPREVAIVLLACLGHVHMKQDVEIHFHPGSAKISGPRRPGKA